MRRGLGLSGPLKGLPNRSLKPTKAGQGTLDRPEGRGVASFARHFPAPLLRWNVPLGLCGLTMVRWADR